MEPKPRGWAGDYGRWFGEAGVVAVYHLRPPYPEELFDRLGALVDGGPVLDAGCGTGDLARGLASRGARVDAVDASPRMIERARQLPGAERVRWQAAPIERAELEPPYTLIVAGDSVHWFDWDVAFARFATWLAPGGTLAIVQREWFPHVEGAHGRLSPIYARWAANPDFRPLDPVEEVERRGYFLREGRFDTEATPWRPTLDELVAVHHSMNGFTPERMGADGVVAFDGELGAAVEELVRDGMLERGADGRLELLTRAAAVIGRPRTQ
ncbi:MAG TPA: class I SAM-dependent methyltransferase [Gaiellaceae bacterium]|jgi:SAM-dependent methyltransferase|nr:class I SAM-dependent methyltransferase [Gaiellaceae bacterium]